MRFCQTGALSEVTVKLSAGARWRAGVDISELPVCLHSTLALRSREPRDAAATGRKSVLSSALCVVGQVCACVVSPALLVRALGWGGPRRNLGGVPQMACSTVLKLNVFSLGRGSSRSGINGRNS